MMKSRIYVKRTLLCALLLSLSFMLCDSGVSWANGNSPPGETGWYGDPCADLRERLEKLEAERAAREKRAAESRKRAAQQRKVVAQKEAARKKEEEQKRLELAAASPTSADIARDTLLMCRNLVEQGRYLTGINALRIYVKDHPRSAEAWYWLARAHHALGDYDRAQMATNIALEIDPYFPALAKSPSGLQPRQKMTKQTKKEPRPSMSVLPVKPVLPAGLALEPVIISFPRLVQGKSVRWNNVQNDVYGSSEIGNGAYLRYDPQAPAAGGRSVLWQQSERFNEISRWRFRVDRMGILKEPRIPIAWKGSRPYEVYFWTGTEWARVRRNYSVFKKERYDDILWRAKADIEKILAERYYVWLEDDTASLAAHASLMRYYWMGEIDLAGAERRANKEARQEEERAMREEAEEWRTSE